MAEAKTRRGWGAGRSALLRGASVVGAAALAFGMLTSVGVSEAAAANHHGAHHHGHHKKGPLSFFSKVKHPTIKGTTINIVWNGTPEASQYSELLDAAVLESWGANVNKEFATSTAIGFADMLHGGSFLAESMTGVINAEKTGLHLAVDGLAEPRQDYEFVARPGISSLSQLSGKTIGVLDMQGLNGVQTDEMLKKANLSQSQVTIDNIGGQSNRLAALISGRIDATMLSHEAVDSLPKTYTVLYDWTKSTPSAYDDVWSSPESFIKSDPNAVLAMNEATLLGFVYFNKGHNNELFRLIHFVDQAATKSTVIPYLKQMRKLGACPDGSILNKHAMKLQEKAYKAVGGITSSPALSQWATIKFSRKAKKALGKAAR